MTACPRATVLICTWNRPGGLQNALEGLAKQTLSLDRFEVVVVDNNSTDNTREVVAAYASRSERPEAAPKHSPRLTYILETRQGKCWALNTGIAAARGEIIACLDDDCVPEPDWLVELLRPFERQEVALVGGTCPSVFSDAVRGDPYKLLLANRFFGDFAPYDEFTEISNKNLPLGMNLAFRKEVAGAVGGFDVRLGPRPEAHLGREETHFIGAAQKQGFRVFYTPSAVVRHHIEDRRISRESIWRHGYFSGMGSCRERHGSDQSTLRKIGPSLIFLAELIYSSSRRAVLVFSPRKSAVARFRTAAALGKLAELWSRDRTLWYRS